MLSKRELIKMLVGLAQMNDSNVIDRLVEDNEVCLKIDREKVILAMDIVDKLVRDFDYENTQEFISQLKNKSEDFVRIKRKLARDPVRIEKEKIRFNMCLASIFEKKEELLLLAPESQLYLIQNLEKILIEVENP